MSQILEQWASGKGFSNTLVIDGHVHVGAWPHAATFKSLDEAADSSINYLNANSVDAFCALGGGYMEGLDDYHLGNDFLLALWERLPERLIPFMSVNANDNKNNILDELKRMYTAGIRCIKLLNTYQQNYPGDGPNLMTLYDFAASNKMLIINHDWSESEIDKIASTFQNIDFIFAHYGGGYQNTIINKYPNVHANIWNYGPMGWLDRGIKQVGAERLMLGSDGFLNSMSVGIGPIVFANISDDEKRLMLGKNIALLLNKVGALPKSLKDKI